MAVTSKFAGAALVLSGLTLSGCATCIDNGTLRAVGFLAPQPHHRHFGSTHQAALVSSPAETGSITHAAASAADSELSKCNQALYLKAQGSAEEIHALEEKCRALIVNQPH